ncbi:hypothetical protein [Pararhodobacter sp.]|uniref:hypothetical protein n=1 Tax=Pararhodobacter sp. TaxID=2127056 RepID=UPI002B003C7F|nr:hypothetical protein [Pararhodobacter sp.]
MPPPGARFRRTSRRLTLLVGAAAIALAGLTASARPAKADTEDILRFLAGAVIIAAIINAVDDRHTPRYIDRWVLPDSCLETMRVNHRRIQIYNARCLSRAGYYNLPNRCERTFWVNGRNRRGYVAECLWDAGYYREGGRYAPPYYAPPRYVPPYFDPPRHSPPYNGWRNPPDGGFPSPRDDGGIRRDLPPARPGLPPRWTQPGQDR